MSLGPGDAFGRYVIEAQLGFGSGGEVYRARDTLLHRPVALKVLRTTGLPNPAHTRARILREARAAAALDHPHAVAIFDVGEHQGTPYLAMEYIAGCSLRTLVGNADVPLTQRVRWLTDVALALAAAHKRGLVHRDVKPENVMVRDDGFVKVVDFGIAKAADEAGPDSNPTPATHGPVGTPHYMAPEQLRHEVLDAQSDEFSWGVLAYELLANGTLPWDASKGALGYVAHVLAEDPVDLLVRNPAVPPSVAAVVDRALCRDPDDRFATMSDIVRNLDPQRGESGPEGVGYPPSVSSDDIAYQLTTRAPVSSGEPRAVPAPAPPGRRGVGAALLVVGAITASVLLVGLALRRHPAPEAGGPSSASAAPLPSPLGTTPVSVLVFDADNRTTEPVFGGSVDQVLEFALRDSRRLFPYQGPSLRKLVQQVIGEPRSPDGSFAREMATRRHAAVVTARLSVAAKGIGYELSLDGRDAASGRAWMTQSRVAADATQVVPTIGRLACDLRAALGDPCDPARLEWTGLSTSLGADQEFSLARGANDTEALEHLTRAVSADPGFLQAYERLGTMLWNLERRTDAEKAFARAFAGIDSMSEHEQLMLKGDYFSTRGEYEPAIVAYEQLLRIWPMDGVARLDLAITYNLNHEPGRALELCRRLADERPAELTIQINLALAELLASNVDASATLLEGLFLRFPGTVESEQVYAAVAMSLVRRDAEARAHYDALESMAPSMAAAGRADLAAFHGRLSEAAAILEKGAAVDVAQENVDGASIKLAALAQTKLRQGDTAGAAAAADRIASAESPSTRYVAGTVYVAAGLPAKALAVAASLAERPGVDPKVFVHLLRGQVLRSKGDLPQALVEMEAAEGVADTWLGRYELGRTHLAAREYAMAREELEACIVRQGEGAFVFLDDVPSLRYLPPVYYYLALAEDGLGNPDAVATWKTFLAHTVDGERDALRTDARRRLANR